MDGIKNAIQLRALTFSCVRLTSNLVEAYEHSSTPTIHSRVVYPLLIIINVFNYAHSVPRGLYLAFCGSFSCMSLVFS